MSSGGWSGGAGGAGAAGGNAGASGGGHGGGGGGPSAFPQKYAKRARMNEEAMQYYAAALCGLMFLFVFIHLTRLFSQKTGLNKATIFAPFHYTSRILRRRLLPRFPGLPSRGHAVLAVLFISINLVVSFVHMDNNNLGIQTNLAARWGWLAVANMVVAVFLSLKNTPLAYISAWSYERVNVMHKIVGSVTMVAVILHACTYASYFGTSGNVKRLREHEEIFGIVSGFCMLALVFAAVVIRRFMYELFYVMHVLFFLATVVFVGLHQPEVAKRILIVTCIVGGLWVFDRSIRFLRLVFYSFNNEATVYPLPDGGTRIVLRKGPSGQVSGSHCFVWIPGVRFFEMHPFTIVSSKSHEFVVASHDGFTRDLHSFATAHPGRKVMASVEGPYGTFPNLTSFDRVIMFAGGSGASFTVGMALNSMESREGKKPIEFHWMVRHRGYFSWFADFIQTLSGSNKVNVKLHVTGNTPPSSSDGPKPFISTPHRSTSPIDIDLEDSDIEKVRSGPSTPSHAENITPCLGNCGAHQICLSSGLEITEGRPDVGKLIRAEVAKAERTERILIMGCGPPSLMDDVRNATAACIECEGPAIELHCEQFGW
ncbi:related to ferric-chelate reductase [Cephalotrichum gorgonifer]|uniref:Related to ferric-chelate reductase n=1 Tax=Cephalotrichum gorgonifer TaxID=2041049 RepID=A0AAE8SSJ8_9PEZI|nr:related to ferric-chelate reductase [Cephalotrichum gorgonifer]